MAEEEAAGLYGAERRRGTRGAAAERQREGGSSGVAGSGSRGPRVGGVRGTADGVGGEAVPDLGGDAAGGAGGDHGQLLRAGRSLAAGHEGDLESAKRSRRGVGPANSLRMAHGGGPRRTHRTGARRSDSALPHNPRRRWDKPAALLCPEPSLVYQSATAAERRLQRASPL